MKHLFKTFTLVLVVGLALSTSAWGQVDFFESFSDGDFTSNPAWSGSTTNWQIVTSSDVSTGATNSYTLRLNAPAVAQTEYLSTQYTGDWGTSQSWSFWLGRRAQAATVANHSIVWLWANESNLLSSTVDGYRVRFGDDSGGDEIFLQRVDNGVATDIITSSSAVPNGLTDIGFMVRVTRTSASLWTLYTSTLPTANGTGAIATNLPDAASITVNQGSVTSATYTNFSDGYFGFAATHSTGASAIIGAEFDQLFFDNNSGSTLPIQLASFVGYFVNSNDVTFEWETISEVNNYGFWIQKYNKATEQFVTIEESFQEAKGEPYTYKWTYQNAVVDNTEYYLLQQDLNGLETRFGPIMLNPTSVPVETAPAVFALNQNYPNPFNPSTVINYQLATDNYTTLKVYNLIGKEVATLVNGYMTAGKHQVTFDGSQLSNGIYFYKLQSGNSVEVKKLTLVK